MDKIFFTAGEKLRYLRKKYNLTQEELVGKEKKDYYISKIENGHRKLDYSTANIINNVINAKVQEIGVKTDVEVTIEWLMADVKKQIKYILKKYIMELNVNPSKEKIENVITKIKELEKIDKVEDYQIFRFFYCCFQYFKKNDLKIAREYLSKMQEITSRNKYILRELYVIKEMTYVNALLEKYEDIVIWGNISKTISKSKNVKFFMKKIEFNMVLAFYMLKKFEICKEMIKYIENEYEFDEEEQFDIEIMKVNCLKVNKKYHQAEKVLDNLIKKTNDSYRSIMCINNIAEIKYLNNSKEAIGIIKKALTIEVPSDISFKVREAELLKNALDIYIKFNYYSIEINNVFEKLYDITILLGDYKLMIKAISSMFNYYKMKNNLKGMRNLLYRLEKLEVNNSQKGILLCKIIMYLVLKDKTFELSYDYYNIIEKIVI
ncbi:helix-turn-helix domain-containing protein [Clostridium felsineum]|uniref:Uncharacterized protein n=1 Tax=Clostridium felsineum TaxID=36839 RepID=A0A1S8LR91_9CLOT|nr:helix-turn-helix transcriptional regulator [Clostridium felsineum]URZ05868.1 hypothetical protein CLROS_012000 [Clostridium felsineum]URZ10905.1 hypothetical protein CROST_016210 [Clostridium felsineum]